jgi:hypothetical protein
MKKELWATKDTAIGIPMGKEHKVKSGYWIKPRSRVLENM